MRALPLAAACAAPPQYPFLTQPPAPHIAGSWSSGHRTGHIMIHTVLMKDGNVVAWSVREQPLP